jgi:Histidine kinase-like ATPase domain
MRLVAGRRHAARRLGDVVRCSVRRDGGGVTVLALEGMLTIAGATVVRAALLKCLAECPAAVVVDLSRVPAAEPTALSVFAAVQRQSISWPTVPLALAAATSRVAAQLHHRGGWAEAPLFDTMAEACAVAGTRRLVLRRVQGHLDAGLDAPAKGRSLVTEACRRWELPTLVEPGLIVISELCANAVTHGRQPVEVILTRGERYLHLVVLDGNPDMPVRAEGQVRPDAEGGRGMHMIGSIAAGWGAHATGTGKAVWAMLTLPGRLSALH